MRHGPSLLGASSLTTLTIQYGLAVFVELQLRNHDLGWGDANGNRLAVNLFAGDTLDVDNVFETVNGCDLSLTALQGAPSNDDFVVLTDGDGADPMLFAQLLRQRSRHDSSADRRRGLEVGLPRLSARGGDSVVQPCHYVVLWSSVVGSRRSSGIGVNSSR